MEKVLFKLLKITLVGINFLSVKMMCDPYKVDVAKSKYGNQIIPSLNNFETEMRLRPIKSKTTFVLNISGMTDLIWQTFAYVLVKFVRRLSQWRGVYLAITSTTFIFAQLAPMVSPENLNTKLKILIYLLH
jgi:hypothetical protein